MSHSIIERSSFKFNRHLKIFTSLLLIIACNIPHSAQDYFPLEIGNMWIYEESEFQSPHKDTFHISVVGDSVMPNNIHYYELSRSIDPFDDLPKFVRADTNYIYFYDKYDSTDYPVYDFKAELQNQYWIGLYSSQVGSLSVMLAYIDQQNIMGQSLTVLVYHNDWLTPFDVDFTKEFGPTGWWFAHHSPPQWSNLIGCRISGVNYGTLVSVEENKNSNLEFTLQQNYPNPFNPTTIIKYNIPSVETGHAPSLQTQLIVYDILGKEVTTLLNKPMPAGSYEIEFDGSFLSSGIYIYRLTAGNFSSSKKMLLLK